MTYNDAYYAVERSEDYLAHYGVKGMHWGVRKAKESNNPRKLDRQWRKANKRLNKLNSKANIADQQKIYKRNSGPQVVANMIGGAGGGMLSGALLARRLGIPEKLAGPMVVGTGIAGAIGGVTPNVIRSKKAFNLSHPEGHAKALNEAHSWAREMNKAFHGTKYQGKTKKFNDKYMTMVRRYSPEEHAKGNAMPYVNYYSNKTGSEIANDFERAYPTRKKKKRR